MTVVIRDKDGNFYKPNKIPKVNVIIMASYSMKIGQYKYIVIMKEDLFEEELKYVGEKITPELVNKFSDEK